jgi:hypothetical protein
MPILPSAPADSTLVEGYLSAGPSPRLYSTQAGRDERTGHDCIQVLRPEARQSEPLRVGRVLVRGRLGVFDDIFELAKLQIGSDHATHELCEARYLILTDIAPFPGN